MPSAMTIRSGSGIRGLSAGYRFGSGFLVVADRDVHAYRGTESRAAVDGQRAADRAQAVGQAGQPQPAWPVKIETTSVVADHQREPAVLLAQRHLDLAGPGVLDHVRQRLGQYVPGGHLDL